MQNAKCKMSNAKLGAGQEGPSEAAWVGIYGQKIVYDFWVSQNDKSELSSKNCQVKNDTPG
jgi:hypothetical protein